MKVEENVSLIRAQLAIACWYLDRAAHAERETSNHYVHHARQAYEIVTRLVADLALGGDLGSLEYEISAVRERLRLAEANEAAAL